jgi:membrane fusion protein, copper/silver efflux system
MSDSHERMPEGVEQAPPGTRTMAIVRWALVAVMGLAALSSVLYYAGVFEGDGGGERVLYYCPMHPSVVQDHPGECPICHMTLVPQEHGRAVHDAAPQSHPVAGLQTVEIAPERIQLMGMKVAPVVREALVPELRASGWVSAPETGLSQVQTRVAGWIERLHVSQTGVTVKKGQTLATIYSPDLLAAQQELLDALEWSKAPQGGHSMSPGAGSVDLVSASRRRLQVLGLSAQDVAQIERTRQPLASVPVRAPQAGTVASKPAVEGAYVQPGTVLYEVADLSKIWVLADVYEHDVARVKVGQKAQLSLESYPGQLFEGTVDFVAPTLDAKTRTMRARLIFPNRDARLKPGMIGQVRVALPPAEGLVVPREAIVDTGAEQYLFVALAGGRFEPRKVKVGARAGDKVQLLDGVSEGEVVVTTANFLIDSESRLRSAIEGQGGHSGHGGP